MSSSERVPTDRLEDLPDRFLRCRVYGHAWDALPVGLARHAYRLIFWQYDVLRCESCGTERYDGVTDLGNVGSRSYLYPHGYATSFSLSRSEARVELLGRRRVTRVSVP